MSESPVILKFGGTSVQDAEALRRLAGIVGDRIADQPVVVVSALAGVTDALVELANRALLSQEGSPEPHAQPVATLAELRERHLRLLAELTPDPVSAPQRRLRDQTSATLIRLFADLSHLARGIAAVGELTNRTRDAVLAFGERLAAPLARMALEFAGIHALDLDARRVIITDEQYTRALPLEEEIQRRVEEQVRPVLGSGLVPVLGGFIGATRAGVTTTLGRGGSDFSAALLGAALDARRVEIWTDVDGMLTADPRTCPDARRIKVISFQEAAELAYFGAKVLHPATLLPAMRKNIPVWVLNSRAPRPGPPDGEATGTLVTTRAPRSSNPFKCITSKRRIAVIDVISTRMMMAHGFLKAIWDIFAKHQCSVDMVSTSEVSVSLTVSDLDRLPGIADELGRFAEVRYEGRKAIVCLVGESLRHIPGLAAKVFAALGDDINVRMISQGASEINIGMVIDDDDVPRAVERLHRHFFTQVDPALFA